MLASVSDIYFNFIHSLYNKKPYEASLCPTDQDNELLSFYFSSSDLNAEHLH